MKLIAFCNQLLNIILAMMQETGTFRKILPQLVASTIKNFLIFDLGVALGFPTIVIASLSVNTQNRPELLSFSNEQASWFGKSFRISLSLSLIQKSNLNLPS